MTNPVGSRSFLARVSRAFRGIFGRDSAEVRARNTTAMPTVPRATMPSTTIPRATIRTDQPHNVLPRMQGYERTGMRAAVPTPRFHADDYRTVNNIDLSQRVQAAGINTIGPNNSGNTDDRNNRRGGGHRYTQSYPGATSPSQNTVGGQESLPRNPFATPPPGTNPRNYLDGNAAGASGFDPRANQRQRSLRHSDPPAYNPYQTSPLERRPRDYTNRNAVAGQESLPRNPFATPPLGRRTRAYTDGSAAGVDSRLFDPYAAPISSRSYRPPVFDTGERTQASDIFEHRLNPQARASRIRFELEPKPLGPYLPPRLDDNNVAYDWRDWHRPVSEPEPMSVPVTDDFSDCENEDDNLVRPVVVPTPSGSTQTVMAYCGDKETTQNTARNERLTVTTGNAQLDKRVKQERERAEKQREKDRKRKEALEKQRQAQEAGEPLIPRANLLLRDDDDDSDDEGTSV